MVIGFDGSRAFGSTRTGTENYSYQLLKALAKIDQTNTYYVYLRSQGQTLRGWPKNFNFKLINWPKLWTQGGLAIQSFKDPLDILFIPSHTLPIIRKPGLNTVITVHDLGSEYLPSMHQLKQRLYLSFMQRQQLKTARRIIAVSKTTKNDLIKRVGISPDKITAIYEGYDKKLFKPVSARGRSSFGRNSLMRFGLKVGEYFLFVGTVQPRKNLDRLIRAFAQYMNVTRGPASSVSRRASSFQVFTAATRRDPSSLSPLVTELLIVGQKGWLSNEIYQLPGKLGIENRVKFLDYVPDKDLPSLYSGAQALVFPSLFEGFGLPILEAQACGCPVMTSNLSSMPEVAGKGAILVNPYDIDDIVKGMVKIENLDTRNKLVKAGFENSKRFSWEKCARETLKVFEELL